MERKRRRKKAARAEGNKVEKGIRFHFKNEVIKKTDAKNTEITIIYPTNQTKTKKKT